MRFMSKIVGLLLATGLAAVFTGGAAQAAPISPLSGVFTHIRNVGNNLCLQPEVPVEGAKVVQQICDDNNIAQGWQPQQIFFGPYVFVNQQSGLCLSVFVRPANGSPMGLQNCRNASGQQFNASAKPPNVMTLETRFGGSTGFCLDVPGGSAALGLQTQIFGCNGSLAQRWVVGF